jgi:hypothetical protein
LLVSAQNRLIGKTLLFFPQYRRFQNSKARLGAPKRCGFEPSLRQNLLKPTFQLNEVYLVEIGEENAIMSYRFDYF